MRRHLKRLVVACLVGPLFVAVGCERFQASAGNQNGPVGWLPNKTAKRKADGTGTPGQESIARVLEADKERFNAGFASLPADAQPSVVGKFIGGYVEHLEKFDTTGCPYEVRAARERHAKAWTLLKTTIERHPDAYDDVDFMDQLGCLFRKDKIKGRKLGGDVVEAVSRVSETFDEIYKAAEGYGVEIE
jgi:hypothetical protein